MLDLGVSSEGRPVKRLSGSADFAAGRSELWEGNSTRGGTNVGITEDPSGFLRVVILNNERIVVEVVNLNEYLSRMRGHLPPGISS